MFEHCTRARVPADGAQMAGVGRVLVEGVHRAPPRERRAPRALLDLAAARAAS